GDPGRPGGVGGADGRGPPHTCRRDAHGGRPDDPGHRHAGPHGRDARSEEHTSELQSQSNLVCRLLLEKKKPVQAMRLFHALALPAWAALLLVAPYLRSRRLRAWQAAVVLILYFGLFELLTDIDVDGAA